MPIIQKSGTKPLKGLPLTLKPTPGLKPKIKAAPKAASISSPATPAKQIPKSNIAPLKTGVERPVLRAFECLVNVEIALKAMQGVGIFIGPEAEKQRLVKESVTSDLAQLRAYYQAYWRQVGIVSGDR